MIGKQLAPTSDRDWGVGTQHPAKQHPASIEHSSDKSMKTYLSLSVLPILLIFHCLSKINHNFSCWS
jgi:hypothetical protein